MSNLSVSQVAMGKIPSQPPLVLACLLLKYTSHISQFQRSSSLETFSEKQALFRVSIRSQAYQPSLAERVMPDTTGSMNLFSNLSSVAPGWDIPYGIPRLGFGYNCAGY